MQPPLTLRINRAPVLTLWAAVVAERQGMPREAALTIGQALAGLTAYSKGVRLGIYAPAAERPHEAPPPLPKGVKNIHDVHLLGRLVHVAETPAGPRAIAKGELVKPEAVERYLRGKFSDALDAVRAELEHLASGFPPERLNDEGFHLYEQFRPEVPPLRARLGCEGRARPRQDPGAWPPLIDFIRRTWSGVRRTATRYWGRHALALGPGAGQRHWLWAQTEPIGDRLELAGLGRIANGLTSTLNVHTLGSRGDGRASHQQGAATTANLEQTQDWRASQ
jgi:hypothetical protein